MSAAVGASLGRYPDRLSCPMNLSTLPLSPSEANPHQAGAAYSRVAIVVARVTSSSCPGGRPWERTVLKATIEAAHLTRVSSKCNVMPRSALSVTPRTFIWVTLAAPGITSGGARHFPPPLLYTINSLVLEALRHRLKYHRDCYNFLCSYI